MKTSLLFVIAVVCVYYVSGQSTGNSTVAVCPACFKACPYGFVQGTNGCPKCECSLAPNPAHPCQNYTLCASSQVCWEKPVTNCNSTSCNPMAQCKVCISCAMACPYGFEMGSDGCPLCKCKGAPDPARPCKNYTLCASSQVCWEKPATNCNSTSCNPVAQCKAKVCISCAMACPYGFEMGSNGCPLCKCKAAPDPAHPCKNFSLCATSQVCWEKPVTNCNSTSCNPVAQCKAKVCITCLMACPYGLEMGSDGCPICKCKAAPDPVHPCKNYSMCGKYEVCKEVQVPCNGTTTGSTSCNPVAKCSPCRMCRMACAYGFVMGSDGCPKCECNQAPNPAHPCQNFSLCAQTQVCRERNVSNCNTPPCNLVARCEVRPCITCLIACPYGLEMGSNGCPRCKCKLAPDQAHPCKNYSLCASSQVCWEKPVTNCNSTSCNPIAQCKVCISCAMACPYGFEIGSDGCPLCKCKAAPDPTHPCKNYSLCATSQVCWEKPVTNCNSPPCNPVAQCKAKVCISCLMACPYGFEMRADGCPICKCISAPDPAHPCKNYSYCGSSQVCWEKPVTNCNSPPCNPIAQCKAKVCISCRMACPYGFEMGSDGCPLCKCKPAPDPAHPCKNYSLCASSQVCWEKSVTNCNSTSCNPIAQCKVCISCAMACPYGFEMGSDGCPLCKCKGAPDPARPCKNYTLCASSQVCWEKPATNCNSTSCNPVAQCKAKVCISCAMACPYGFEMGSNGCPLCKCKAAPDPAHPCKNFSLCATSQVCWEKPVTNCNSTSCNPVAQCKAKVCITCLMACPYGLEMGSDGCPICKCKAAPDPVHPCKNYSMCGKYEVCKEVQVPCNGTTTGSTSCNPVAKCSPCRMCRMACAYGFVMGSDGCPKCECNQAPNPAHPCQNFSLCAQTQVCRERNVSNCNTPPCNLVARCEVRPCITCLIACPYGLEMGSNGCPRCKCKLAPDPAHPCKNYSLCASSQVCWEKPVTNCNSTSCNPIAQCKVCISCAMACPYGFEIGSDGCPLCKCKAAPDPTHPCKNYSLCATSQVCWEKPVTNCNSPPCNPVAQCKAKVCISCLMACPYGFEMRADGCPICKCISAPDPAHPCKNYSYCGSSQVCWEKPVTNCNSPPCNPIAQCKAKVCISCRMACPYGFEMGSDGCPLCKCKPAPDPAHPCKNYSLCASSQVCWEKSVTNCNSTSCNPIAQCKVCISCAMACPYGFEIGSDGCPLCKCKAAPDPTHPCKNYSLCATSQVCWEKPVTNCNSPPCNPVAQCKAKVCISCLMACPYGFEMRADGCPICKCISAPDPAHPCKNYSYCGSSQVCWEKPVTNCNSPPCNPIAQCKAKVCISCRMACPYGFEMGSDGCPLCKCKPAPDPAHPCKNYSLCASSQVCWEKSVTNCNSTSCNPIAQCKVCISCAMACPYGFEIGSDGCPLCKCKAAPDPTHPCKNYSLCATSQVCWEKPVTNCNSPPCNPVAQCKAKVCISCLMACPYGFEMRADGCPICKCKSAPDPAHPCKNYSYCGSSQVCWEKPVTNCNSPPCNPIAQCKAKVCISCRMACPYGFEMGSDGCPLCKCKPAPDPAHPCKNYSLCASSQVCWEKPVTNCNSTSCNPIAQCKVCISCAMACPYGFEIGSDGCPMCKCKMATDPAHPCKNYSLCATSQVCWEKPVTNCNSPPCNPVAQCKAKVCINCLMACPYGFEMGSDGCPVCKCKSAPDPAHPCKNYTMCGKYEVCKEVQVPCNGTTTSSSTSCNPVAKCSPCRMCRMACPYDFVMGSDGCPKCECRPAPNPTHPCQNYSLCAPSQVCMERNLTNCNSPPCNPVARCEVPCRQCMMACAYGFVPVKDSYGCPKCECNPIPDPAHPCKNFTLCGRYLVCREVHYSCNGTSTSQCNPRVVAQCGLPCKQCRMACPYGFVMGSDGCPKCECKSAPNPAHPCLGFNNCPSGYTCKEHYSSCSNPPCRLVPKCERLCPQCRMACPYGFRMGPDGCPLCQCNPAPDPWDPCRGYTGCASGQVCQSKTVQCITSPCYPQPECIKEKLCKSGQPLMDIYNKEIFCGRGLNRQNCPSGYTCNVDPLDRFAVCCPDAVTVRPWRPCPTLPKGYGGGCYTECTTDSECNNKYSAGQMQCCPTDCGFACVYTDIQVNGATTVTSSMLAIVLMIGLMVLRQLRE